MVSRCALLALAREGGLALPMGGGARDPVDLTVDPASADARAFWQLASDDEAALGEGAAGEEALLQDEELLMRFTKH